MSTRATYQILDQTFYVHHDGYPTGAAQKFVQMVAAMTVPSERECGCIESRRGGYPFAFIRGVMAAEPTEGHDAHGDTEFQYTLMLGVAQRPLIKVVDVRNKRSFTKPLAFWLADMRANYVAQHNAYVAKNGGKPIDENSREFATGWPVVIEVYEETYGWKRYTLATKVSALAIAGLFEADSAKFKPDNPNKAASAKRAADWLAAVNGKEIATA